MRAEERSPRDRARLFAFVWLVGALALFTITITKYHHYILPALPPAAILIAIYLDELVEGRVRGLSVGLLTALGVLAMVSYDLVKQPAQWVWMYTYLYDQNWARGVPEGTTILVYAVVIGVLFLLFAVRRLRKAALWLSMAVSVGVADTCSLVPAGRAPNWSQKSAISSYYKLRKSRRRSSWPGSSTGVARPGTPGRRWWSRRASTTPRSSST